MDESKRGRPALSDQQRADAQIHLRVTARRKSAYVRAANRRKQTLADFIFEHCDRAADFKDAV